MNIKNCAHCGSEFAAAQKCGQPQKYCGARCRNRAKSRAWKPKKKILTCEHCKSQFETYHKRRFCSEKCRETRPERKKKRAAYAASVKAAQRPKDRPKCKCCWSEIPEARVVYYNKDNWCSDLCRNRYRKAKQGANPVHFWTPPGWVKHKPLYTHNCAVCNSEFESLHLQKIYCDGCIDAYGADGCKRAVMGLHETSCINCGVVFCRMPNTGIRFCSKKCADEREAKLRRSGKARRRAKLRGNGNAERFDPFEIFERDGWRCRRCSRPTPKRYRGTTKPNAPELDHIIPVSKGGPHTRRNTQCLCRKCNIEKSDNATGDQLLLIG